VPVTVRPLDESHADAFGRLDDAAFSVRSTPEQVAQSLTTIEWPRMLGAFDGDDALCGVAGAFTQRLTVPGGGRVDMAGVTAVGVAPTHRRRGVLTALMAHQLDDVAAAGEPVAVLTASEATIYGRFGYGLASRHQSARVDRARAGFAASVAPGWTLRLVEDDEALALAPPRFEAHLADRVGGVTRPSGFWPAIFGPTETWVGGGEHFTVMCDPPPGDDRPGGYALYKVRREGGAGHWVTVVGEVVAAEPEAEALLWRYLLDVDLTEALEISSAPLDDLLPWRLANWRAYRVTGQADFLWVRILDPVAALSARTYGSTDQLVLDVADRFRPPTAGTYRVTASAGGRGQVDRSGGDPDLVLDIADLGALYLGGVSVTALVRAGRLAARTPEVALRADRFFAAERQPFCLTHF
jgi:predicted acetyltransferase